MHEYHVRRNNTKKSQYIAAMVVVVMVAGVVPTCTPKTLGKTEHTHMVCYTGQGDGQGRGMIRSIVGVDTNLC